MDIRPIQNDDDHAEALREIERLWDFADDSPENQKLDVLATLVEAYEKRRWPVDRPTPRDMLDYAITDMGRSQTELAELLGSRSLASELLAGKKRVSLYAAQKISTAWEIPIQLLVAAEPPDSLPAYSASLGKVRLPASGIVQDTKEFRLRLDRAAIDAFKKTGDGWQLRLNSAVMAASKKLQKGTTKRAG